MVRYIDALRIVFACAGFGVLAGLLAVIVSIVLAINGTQNHISAGWLALVCLAGAVLSLPFVWRRMSRLWSRKNRG